MLNPDFRDILRELNAADARYLVVGAYALAAHGFPRATGDLDIFVLATPANAERVWAALTRFRAPLDELRTSDLTNPEIVFQIGIAPRRVDILTSIDGVAFDEAWDHRIEITVDGVPIPVLGKSDLIRNKRAVGRPQDLADIARLEDG